MRNMVWMKKGILCGLTTMYFMMGFGTVQAEAGWATLTIRKEAAKDRAASKEETESTKESDLIKKKQELEQLRQTKIPYMISCSYCGGSGRSTAACIRCDGKGIADIPGNLSLVMSCGYCMGSGREKCGMCMYGKMENPDYFVKCDARDKKIKELEAEIAQMEGKSTENPITNPDPNPNPDPGPFPNPIPDPDPNPISRISVECVKCKGTGRVTCTSCKGTGYLEKTNWTVDYSGSGSKSYTTRRSCYCDNGTRTCTVCGGTGEY